MSYFTDTKIRWKNAQTCIAQMKRGEWKPIFNDLSNKVCTAERNGKELWLANGPLFVEIYERGRYTNSEKSYFGLIFRHLVWWRGGRSLSRFKITQAAPAGQPVLEDGEA